MADVLPFRGIRPNPDRIGDLSRVIAPPYDVISPARQEALCERDPHNVVRLILGQDRAGDDDRNNKYSRAASTLRDWLRSGILVRDDSPSLYVYQQQFSDLSGAGRARTGLIGAVRLQEFDEGGVRPHELTRDAPKEDRLRLLRACRANLSSIFALCDDPPIRLRELLDRVTAQPSIAAADDDERVGHRLWKIDSSPTVRELQAALTEWPLFIADGHHRYETALNYRSERRGASESWNGSEPENFSMMTIVSAADPGLVILPTHRLLKIAGGVSLQKGVSALGGFFETREIETDGLTLSAAARRCESALSDEAEHAFVLCTRETTLLLRVPDRSKVEIWLDSRRSVHYNSLDVTILHSVILDGILRETGLEGGTIEIDYTPDSGEALRRVRSGQADIAFLLRPTRIDQVLSVASAGEKMPPKSTYFYPKLITGMVMRGLDD